MQVRDLWRGKHGEVHGVFVGDELEIVTTVRGRRRILRLVPAEGGVRVIDKLPDGMLAETLLMFPRETG
jgi:hypothetical protein